MRKLFSMTVFVAASLLAIPASADDIVSLRCTITPEGGKAFSGYLWLDMLPRKAWTQWWKSGGHKTPAVEGPLKIQVTPNEMTVAGPGAHDPQLRLDRATAMGTLGNAHVACGKSDVPLPLPVAPSAPASRAMPVE